MFEISYGEESNILYTVCNNIECVFRKSGENKYLIFCETIDNERMLKNYTKIIDEIKEETLFIH